jgi:hypothetical protein
MFTISFPDSSQNLSYEILRTACESGKGCHEEPDIEAGKLPVPDSRKLSEERPTLTPTKPRSPPEHRAETRF